jgi:uncharacterized protein
MNGLIKTCFCWITKCGLIRMMQWIRTFFILGLLCSFGCSSPETELRRKTSSEGSIQQERESKDAVFKSSPESPILSEDRLRFRGLSYFPVDPGLEFSVRLMRYQRPEQVRLGTNTGEIRSGLRYGYFDFQVQGKNCRLQVYRLDDVLAGGGAALFIPFRDSTTGLETYPTGRYIDLKENTSGIYKLDFNRAYNPFCAYNSTYSCPVPPVENTLAVAIRAGEKKYH